MTLEKIITSYIDTNGPLSVADYMAMVLTHPEYGYYMRKDPLGAKGDFITAPEICQIFGELIGAWLAAQWIGMGRPEAALAELGPGRGTLMNDILRATKTVPGFHQAITVHLVEASPALKQKQWNALAGKHPHVNWHDYFDDLPPKPLLLVANEFFDALPIRQYVYLPEGWRERFIKVEDGKLAFTIPATAGRVIERCESGKEWAASIGKHIAAHTGVALIIDYGYPTPPRESNETLQAMRGHKFHDVLTDPGTADLTAHVDFGAIGQAALEEGTKIYGPIAQGQFLVNIGAAMRTAILCETATDDQKSTMISSMERLISPKQMGELFKVLCITHPTHPAPEGL